MAIKECPRCGGCIPSNARPGAYPGALSRWDNKTEICSECGVDEALMQMAGMDLSPTGASLWKVKP